MWFDEDINLTIETDSVINVSGAVEFSNIDTVTVHEFEQPIIIQTSEYFAPVQSVNGKVGFVNLTAEDLGISGLNVGTFVNITGNQTVNGIKNFTSRPTVNGTGVLLSGEAYPSNNPSNFISSDPPTGSVPLDLLIKYVTGINTGITFYEGVFPNIYFTENPVLFISLTYENTGITSINEIAGKNRYLIDLSYRNQTGFGVVFSDQISETGINLNVLAYGKGVNL
jgi:hypothetical protein